MAITSGGSPDVTPDGEPIIPEGAPVQPEAGSTGDAPVEVVGETVAEFPTEWHRQAYIDALQRELEGTKVRGDAEAEANAARELTRLGVVTETRPAGAGKAKR